MATPRLSRYLGGIFALCYLSSTTVIIWLCAFSTSSPAMAAAFVSVTPTPTPCPKTVPHLAPGLFQDANGTIKSITGLTLQIIPKTPGTPINATYSSTTRITERTLITTPPASVLLKGIDVSVQAIPNPNSTFTATLITLMQGKQPDNRGCFAGKGGGLTAPGNPPGPVNKPTVPKKPNFPRGGQLDGGGCFADRGPTQKTAPAAPTPTPSASKQSTCRVISGTVELLNGNTLTIIDRQQTSHIISLTSGANATKIIKTAPATASALKVGTSVMVMGPANKGVIAASSITIGTL
ncbi:MAG TPA: hypothetical protein VGL94_04455 [Ktedonobacteraceae bacterium]